METFDPMAPWVSQVEAELAVNYATFGLAGLYKMGWSASRLLSMAAYIVEKSEEHIEQTEGDE